MVKTQETKDKKAQGAAVQGAVSEADTPGDHTGHPGGCVTLTVAWEAVWIQQGLGLDGISFKGIIRQRYYWQKYYSVKGIPKQLYCPDLDPTNTWKISILEILQLIPSESDLFLSNRYIYWFDLEET